MSGLGLRLLGGALSGVGAGLVQQGQINATQRYEAWKMKMQQEINSQTLIQTAALNDQNKAAEQKRSAEYDAQNDTRTVGGQVKVEETRQGGAVVLEGLKAKTATVLETLKHNYNLNETQFRIAQQTAADLIKTNTEIGEVRVSDSGRLVFYNKAGKLVSQTEPNQFPISGDAAEGTDNGTKRPTLSVNKPAAKTGQPSETPAPADEKAQALAQLGTIYDSATPQTYPGLFRNGQKISREEAQQIVESRYGQ